MGKTQAAPGVGVYLNFRSPPYAAGSPVPFFGFDGDVTLQFTYPKSESGEDHKAAPKEIHASTSRTASKNNDEVEEFPWDKVVDGVKDPAVKAHLLKYFSQKPAAVAHDPSRPSIAEASGVTVVKPRSVSAGAILPRRSKTFLDPGRPRRWDDLARASGNPRRVFQAIDAQNVFVLGADGVLYLEHRSLGSASVASVVPPVISQVVDRNVESFEAISIDEVLTLRKNGPLMGNHNALWEVRSPFGTSAEGACIEGFVWRQASSSSDHVCVTVATRTQAGTDNAAGASHTVAGGRCAEGFVWRQADKTDHVCVSPAARDQTATENRYARYRVAGPSPTKFIEWPVSRFEAGGGDTLLDPSGQLWRVASTPGESSKPIELTKDVRAFQVLDPAHFLILKTDDTLQPYPGTTGTPGPSFSNVWAFQQTADGNLFIIDGSDTLRREDPAFQIDTDVESFQAIDGNTVFVLKYDGALTRRQTAKTQLLSQIEAPILDNVRAFQALDAKTVFILDDKRQLWLEQGDFGPELPTKILVAHDLR